MKRERDLWLTAALVILSIATILPIWIGHYLPLLDLPNHLSAIAVWHHHKNPLYDFDKYYDLNLSPLPYWAHYYTCHLLAYLFDVEVANKLFLTAYALALPFGALAFARRFGRSPWLALFVFPLVWNHNVAEGFIAYSAGMAACVVGLTLVDRHATRPTLGSALAVMLAGTSIYFFHLLPYMLFLVCAGLLVFAHERPLSLDRLLVRGVPILACTYVGLWAYQRESTLGFQSLEGTRQFSIDRWVETLGRAPFRLMDMLASGRDEWVVVVLALAWLLLAVTAARGRSPEPDRPFARTLGPDICFVLLALAVLLVPRSMHRPFYWYMINGRFVPLCALFAALLIRGPIAGRRRLLMLPVFGAALFYMIDLSQTVVRFNRHTHGFDALAAKIPLHQSTLTLSLPPLGDPLVTVNCFNQWASYTQIRRGGYNFYNFNQGFPLKYKMMKPAPPWTHAEWFNWEAHGAYWDYFLTHNEGAPYSEYDIFAPLERRGVVELVGAHGPWKLWRRVENPPYGPDPRP